MLLKMLVNNRFSFLKIKPTGDIAGFENKYF